MDYDLRDMKLLFFNDPDDEDVEDVLLLKLLEREQDLADAAEQRRLMKFSLDALPELNFHEKFRFMKKRLGRLVFGARYPSGIQSP